MSESETYLLLEATPPENNAAEDVLVITYLKNIKTNIVTKHNILNRPTRFPRLLSCPSEYISSPLIFTNEKELLETIISHPTDTYLLEFNPTTRKSKTLELPFLVKATPFERIRQPEARGKKAYQSMLKMQIDAENERIYQNALNNNDTIDNIETYSDSSIISQNILSFSPKRVSQLTPDNDPQTLVTPILPKRTRVAYKFGPGTTANRIPLGNRNQGLVIQYQMRQTHMQIQT